MFADASGARRPDLARQRRSSIAPIAQTAKGGIEFWPALKPPTTPEQSIPYLPVDVEQPDSPVVRLAEQHRRPDRGLAGQRRDAARP